MDIKGVYMKYFTYEDLERMSNVISSEMVDYQGDGIEELGDMEIIEFCDEDFLNFLGD